MKKFGDSNKNSSALKFALNCEKQCRFHEVGEEKTMVWPSTKRTSESSIAKIVVKSVRSTVHPYNVSPPGFICKYVTTIATFSMMNTAETAYTFRWHMEGLGFGWAQLYPYIKISSCVTRWQKFLIWFKYDKYHVSCPNHFIALR